VHPLNISNLGSFPFVFKSSSQSFQCHKHLPGWPSWTPSQCFNFISKLFEQFSISSNRVIKTIIVCLLPPINQPFYIILFSQSLFHIASYKTHAYPLFNKNTTRNKSLQMMTKCLKKMSDWNSVGKYHNYCSSSSKNTCFLFFLSSRY